MIHERLDHGCHAKVLFVSPTKVLLTASWPASKPDEKKFHVIAGIAYNTVEVPREYFERKYGKVL